MIGSPCLGVGTHGDPTAAVCRPAGRPAVRRTPSRTLALRARVAYLRVRVEVMGSHKCGIVGESQPVLIMINPMIFTRTRMSCACAQRGGALGGLPAAAAADRHQERQGGAGGRARRLSILLNPDGSIGSPCLGVCTHCDPIIIASADRWATRPARYAARSGRCWAAAAAARRGRGRPPSSACWRRRRGARRARRPPVRLACPPVPIGPPCLGVCIHCDPIAAVRRRRAMACLSMHRRRKNTGRGRALPVRPQCARWLSAAAAAGGDCLASPSSSPSKARGVTALQVRGA
jgi:hypothetical protein